MTERPNDSAEVSADELLRGRRCWPLAVMLAVLAEVVAGDPAVL